MQKEVRLTDEEWAVVMRCLHQHGAREVADAADLDSQAKIALIFAAIQTRILTQLRCHEAKQTMAPACCEVKHGQKA